MMVAAAAGALTIISSAAQAASIVYGGSGTIGAHSYAPVSVSFSVTTDGTLGLIRRNNVTEFQVTFSDQYGKTVLNSSNSTLFMPTALLYPNGPVPIEVGTIASVNSLTQNFPINISTNYSGDKTANLSFHQNSVDVSYNEAILPAAARFGTINFNGPAFTALSGAVSSVPETKTWAMMLLGVGLVGSVMRRRRNVRTSVKLA
jgi:hypothetical protein